MPVTMRFTARNGKKFTKTFRNNHSAGRARQGWMSKGGGRPTVINKGGIHAKYNRARRRR